MKDVRQPRKKLSWRRRAMEPEVKRDLVHHTKPSTTRTPPASPNRLLLLPSGTGSGPGATEQIRGCSDLILSADSCCLFMLDSHQHPLTIIFFINVIKGNQMFFMVRHQTCSRFNYVYTFNFVCCLLKHVTWLLRQSLNGFQIFIGQNIKISFKCCCSSGHCSKQQVF